MSFVFEVNEVTVWSPALDVGKIYLAQADCLASILGVDKGMWAMADDFFIIDEERFGSFVAEVLASPRTRHPLLAELTQAFVAVSLVILKRAGHTLDLVDANYGNLERTTSFVERLMPR